MGTRFNQDVGSPTNQRVVQITSTPRQIVMVGYLYKTIELYNADSVNVIYFGDQNVTISNGMPFFPGDYRYFKGVNNGFSIWLVCASGQTANMNVIEYA